MCEPLKNDYIEKCVQITVIKTCDKIVFALYLIL